VSSTYIIPRRSVLPSPLSMHESDQAKVKVKGERYPPSSSCRLSFDGQREAAAVIRCMW
jgi:hypothetical protein